MDDRMPQYHSYAKVGSQSSKVKSIVWPCINAASIGDLGLSFVKSIMSSSLTIGTRNLLLSLGSALTLGRLFALTCFSEAMSSRLTLCWEGRDPEEP